jgi:hypothetical protein
MKASETAVTSRRFVSLMLSTYRVPVPRRRRFGDVYQARAA